MVKGRAPGLGPGERRSRGQVVGDIDQRDDHGVVAGRHHELLRDCGGRRLDAFAHVPHAILAREPGRLRGCSAVVQRRQHKLLVGGQEPDAAAKAAAVPGIEILREQEKEKEKEEEKRKRKEKKTRRRRRKESEMVVAEEKRKKKKKKKKTRRRSRKESEIVVANITEGRGGMKGLEEVCVIVLCGRLVLMKRPSFACFLRAYSYIQ